MNFTAIARENLEEKGMLLKNKVEIEANYNALPDVYMLHIARKDVATNEIESFFTVDRENGNLKEFNKLKENVQLIEKKTNDNYGGIT